LAEWKFELLITQSASDEYEGLRRIAEAAVSGYDGPLPVNSDSRLQPRIAAIEHYGRVRKILKSIMRPEDVSLDMGISGPAHFVRYRTEIGTCVYYTRIVTSPPLVLVYGFCDSPLDFGAIRSLVLSGNTHLLERFGLPPIQMDGISSLIN
jgi:hypothetical protein